MSFPVFECSFSVLEHPFPVLEHLFLLCPVLSRVPSRSLAVPARPVPDFGCPGPWQDFELVPLSLCPGTMKELLSLCPKKLHCPVPLETLVHIQLLKLI